MLVQLNDTSDSRGNCRLDGRSCNSMSYAKQWISLNEQKVWKNITIIYLGD
jgi:hypothetical protein